MNDGSLDRTYFETLYDGSPDPWRFATSAYEREKYAASLAALDRPRYARALEIGCSIGVFTAALAARCETLLAIDISTAALERARKRCVELENVRFERLTVPGDFPDGEFDLVTLCEVGYYFDDGDAQRTRERIVTALEPNGTLLLVHFLPKVDDYLRDGDGVHTAYVADPRFELRAHHRSERYRIDVLTRL